MSKRGGGSRHKTMSRRELERSIKSGKALAPAKNDLAAVAAQAEVLGQPVVLQLHAGAQAALMARPVKLPKAAPNTVTARPDGLVEVPASPGSPWTVLVTPGGCAAAPEQLVVMAKLVQERKNTGAYVKHVAPTAVEEQSIQPQGDVTMGNKTAGAGAAATLGMTEAEIVAAHAKSRKEVLEREAKAKADAEAKAKDDEERRAKEAKARKKTKARDVAPKAKPAPQPSAPAAAPKPGKKARPGDYEPTQAFVVLKDNTRSGHMKTFMAAAGQLKKFTRKALVDAAKAKVTADRAERYFDYCLYQKLIGPAK